MATSFGGVASGRISASNDLVIMGNALETSRPLTTGLKGCLARVIVARRGILACLYQYFGFTSCHFDERTPGLSLLVLRITRTTTTNFSLGCFFELPSTYRFQAPRRGGWRRGCVAALPSLIWTSSAYSFCQPRFGYVCQNFDRTSSSS